MSVNDLQSRIGSRRRMASTIAGDIDGAHRKRSRKDDKPADRGLPENAVEDRRHRRPFKDSERKRPERRRSRTRSPPPPPPPAGGGGGGGGGGRHRSSNTPPRSRSHFQDLRTERRIDLGRDRGNGVYILASDDIPQGLASLTSASESSVL